MVGSLCLFDKRQGFTVTFKTSSLGLVPEENIENRSFYDRFTMLRYTPSNTRNKLAGAIALFSGLLFLLSGYKANIIVYHLIENQIRIHAAGQMLALILFSIGIVAASLVVLLSLWEQDYLLQIE